MSAPRLQAIRGMNDLLPPEDAVWQHIEETARRVLRNHGYSEVRTPIVEPTALFARGVGETTDIVEKEMYTFADRDESFLSLRPEGTAGCVRAYVEHAVHKAEPVTKWYYSGPMYRHERPQKGRYRQFYQIGAEALGSDDPMIDAEMVALLEQILIDIGVTELALRISSVGCNEPDCRPAYRAELRASALAQVDKLCPDCVRRIEKNPLRILDCKQPGCTAVARTLKKPLEGICARCHAHFGEVRAYLNGAGVKYLVDPGIVRGLDYYTRTAFEVHGSAPGLGSQNALGGGGRYDGLVEALGGPSIPGVGFAVGVERIALALGDDAKGRHRRSPTLFLAAPGDVPLARSRAFELATLLRRQGHAVELDPRGGSLKSQLKRADRLGARWVGILGPDELAAGEVSLKRLDGGTQERIAQSELAAKIAVAVTSPG